MPGPFDRLVERQMLKASADGKLTGLAGEGQPLPDRSGEGDAALSAAMRVMAEAGVRPQEFDLKAQLDAARAAYAALTDPAEKKAAMARIADLDMRYTMARDARRSFFR
ncbi:DnaJ family domain-containing protein [Seohaeicola zhoushanensis]|uniref:DUF1992 domain-containing protein n=1 Tax=Seohaeicola zhoushanensis TaxID=1569283 RepID=A0A8J3H0E9_9RHOB|nr:DnaJ family domain-containing protein [Seohaeicola zhoushanensis]GHF67759.1 DUF1992 domain-containing protein [Seohaeicola zhoushanensis]